MYGIDAPRLTYVYRARPMRVVDGDTIDVMVDMGLHAYRLERLRLLGVNCPEMRGASHDAGVGAKTFTSEWLMGMSPYTWDDWPLVIHTEKSDAFGRFLAVVWRASGGQCLNDDLLSSGHAVVFGG